MPVRQIDLLLYTCVFFVFTAHTQTAFTDHIGLTRYRQSSHTKHAQLTRGSRATFT